MYADDVQLHKSCPLGLIEHCAQTLNEDLQNIYNWSRANSLVLNPEKSKVIVISKKSVDLSYFPRIYLNNVPIDFVDNAKNLGFIFNRNLTWKDHVNSIVGKVYGALRTLWATKDFTPLKTRKMLAKTLVIPILTYGCEIFCKSDAVSQRKLNVAYNNIARYIYGLGRYDHVSRFSKSIYGMSFDSLLNFRTLLLLFNIIQSHHPSYLYNRLQFSASNRLSQLIVPRFSCLTSEKQFLVNAVRLWNSLPPTVRRTSNLTEYRTRLQLFLSASD